MSSITDEHLEHAGRRLNQLALSPAPLNIGVLVDTGLDELSDWQWWLLDRLARDPRIHLSALVLSGQPKSSNHPSGLAAGVLTLDRWLTASLPPFKHRELRRDIEALPVAYLCGEEKICRARHKFDIILRLGLNSLSEEALALARFGEWSLSFADCRVGSVDWTGFDAVYARAATVPIAVVARHADQPDSVVVAKANYSPKVSAARTSAFVHEKSVLLLQKALADLADKREFAGSRSLELVAQREKSIPSTADTLLYGLRLVARLGERTSEALSMRVGRDQTFWQLSFGKGRFDDFDPKDAIDMPRTEINMADPFLFEHQGSLYVFYEADHGGCAKAWISVGLIENGVMRPLGEVLRCPYHLSYPHVFRRGDEIFMMPETQQAKRLEIWRCIEFPFRWELHATAFDGQYAVDSNLIEIDGNWWLFTNLSEHYAFQDHNSELYLFRVDGPDLRQVRAHPRNPVVIGGLTARNAGPIIRANGRLYRPSQIHAYGTYGYGLNISEIEALDDDTYKERLVRQFTPVFREGILGVHHISFCGDHYVIDSRRARED